MWSNEDPRWLGGTLKFAQIIIWDAELHRSFRGTVDNDEGFYIMLDKDGHEGHPSSINDKEHWPDNYWWCWPPRETK